MTHFGLTDEVTPPVVQLTQNKRMAATSVNFNFMTSKENDDRFLFALKTCTVNLDSSKAGSRLTQPMASGAGEMGK